MVNYSKTIIFIIIVLTLFIVVRPSLSVAQGQGQWTPQTQIPDYGDYTEESPFLIADVSGRVHAFNSQPFDLGAPDSEEVVVYRTWTLKDGWSVPNDIIIDPTGTGRSLKLLDVYYTSEDIVHLAVAIGGEVFHTKTTLAFAGQAHAWGPLTLVGSGATIPYVGSMAGDDGDNIFLIYGSSREGNGIDAVRSSDQGETWSDPEVIYKTFDADLTATGTDLLVDSKNIVHAVWAVINSVGNDGFGFYSRLDSRQPTWAEAISLDETKEGGLGIWFPVLFEYKDLVFASYYNGGFNNEDNAFWWRLSQDNGNTWGPPIRYSNRHVGTNGPVATAIDSRDRLHLFFGQRINDDNHGVWHIIWNETSWMDPVPVVRGPQVRSKVGDDGFDPRSPGVAIVNGNLALVTWATDGFAGVNGVWYSYATLDAPELPAQSLPIPTATATKIIPTATTASTTPSVTPSPTRPVFFNNINNNNLNGVLSNPLAPFVLGIVPVALLLAVIIIRQFTHTTRQ
jgi:hypothetical protein